MNKAEKAVKELIKSKKEALEDLDGFKRKMAAKFEFRPISSIELLESYHRLVKNKRIKRDRKIEYLLTKKKVRSLSGIVNVSVLTKPYPCPGKCIFCPAEKNIPQSYLKKEPAVQRAVLTKFDPYLQIQTRLRSLVKTGHPVDKIELRIIGGTWSFYPKRYQNWFIARCFQAANNFPKNIKCNPFLKKEQKKNERAKNKIIGITIETRPDFITEEEIKRLRKLGVTRVELGVQSIYDDVLKRNKRGHKVSATARAAKLLKDAGFKVSFQMMPNLMGSTYKKDIEMFKKLFSESRFCPDLLKIYPLALVKNTPLYKKYLKGEFKPYTKKRLTELLTSIKQHIPYWCRIQRVIRDIPSQNIVEGGAKTSNLREVVQKEMGKQGLSCKCIRCREVKENYDPKEKLYLYREDYEASGGKEIFLSYENKTRSRLYSLLRMRIPSRNFISVLKESAIVRELHTYGRLSPLREKIVSPQHKGLGKKLMKEAERIAKEEYDVKNIAVISGIGVRGYYRKLGYRLKDTYMVKTIEKL